MVSVYTTSQKYYTKIHVNMYTDMSQSQFNKDTTNSYIKLHKTFLLYMYTELQQHTLLPDFFVFADVVLEHRHVEYLSTGYTVKMAS